MFHKGCATYIYTNQKYEKMNIFKSNEVCKYLDINTSKDKLIIQSSPGNIFVLDVKNFQLIFLFSNKNINSQSSIYFLNDINFIVIDKDFYFNIFSVMEYRPLITYSKYCYEKWNYEQRKYFKNEIFQKIGNNRFIIANIENMKLFKYKNNKVQEIGDFEIRIYSIIFFNDIGIDNCIKIYRLENDKK